MSRDGTPALIRERGVALMLVLWVIVVLGTIAAAVLSASRAQIDLAGTLRARTVARYAAESGVVVARSRFAELYRAATPSERAHVYSRFATELAEWGQESVGAAKFQVAVLDLGSRIDLNQSPDQLVQGLFEELFGQREGARLADALRPGDGEPVSLRRLDDLTRLPGFNDSLLTALAPFVTVRGDGRVNVNTAPIQVLAALPGIGRDGAVSIVGARDREGPLASRLALSQYLAGDPGIRGASSPVSTEPSRILIVSRGWLDGHPLTHEIQVVLEIVRGFLDSPMRLRVRQWTERDL